MTRQLFSFQLVILFFLVAVVPNSLGVTSAITMLVGCTLATHFIIWTQALREVIALYLLSALVTIIYMMIGFSNWASTVALAQTFIIYVCSPLIWIVILAGMLEVVSERKLISWAIVLTFLGIISVGIFFYLFLNYGESSVLFFIKEPNVNLTDGFSAATLHVYGSLIFFTGAFFATPLIVKDYITRYILLGSLAVCAATSGRSALIISLFLGMIIGFIFRPKLVATDAVQELGETNNKFPLLRVLAVAGIFSLIVITLSDIDPTVITRNFIDKLLSGGGSERTEQAEALMASIWNSSGMGMGHGVEVSYLRSDEFPWRYELIWLATLHRVGILGFIIYGLPFMLCALNFFHKWRQSTITETDVFVFSGFISALVASATNPYIEAFSFQWMYILPIVYFLVGQTINDNECFGRSREPCL
jgi:hypothetical protein